MGRPRRVGTRVGSDICTCTGVPVCYSRGRGFARLPPRAKPLRFLRRSRRSGLTSLTKRLEHLLGVAIGLHLRPAADDHAVRAHEERRPDEAHVLLAVVHLLAPCAPYIGDLVALVRQERERQAELRPELLMRPGIVGADPPDLGLFRLDALVQVAELARLGGAARRVVLGIEVDDGPLATAIAEAVDRAGLIGERDLGRLVAGLGHRHRPRIRPAAGLTRPAPRRSADGRLAARPWRPCPAARSTGRAPGPARASRPPTGSAAMWS